MTLLQFFWKVIIVHCMKCFPEYLCCTKYSVTKYLVLPDYMGPIYTEK